MANHKATAADASRARAAYRTQMLDRRDKVEMLLAYGYTVRQIASTLGKDYKTIKSDADAIHTQWQVERSPDIGQAIARSIQVQRLVMQKAWITYEQASPGNPNRVGALNTVMAADKEIRSLEGVSEPERINAAALADIMDALSDTLLEVGGPATYQVFLQRLRARSSGIGSTSANIVPNLAAIVGAGHAAAMQSEALTVDADSADAAESADDAEVATGEAS